ncbi:DeoR/GlpR family DNA-binding transcription regulator [Halobacillus karajensis]|uniref:HTH-type transcriptional repressor GlcR n=1 Tax=Halobacillus karajensis TaxID=195088 RepID=A0A024P2J4_9BACI|nr:DeoR/GlpR family DNA-binding transcription regulator [Halobacillus karajensis]CDQ19374.1 HTH-type transcriptional repressor GlcR [Halobacillus karajensis]CDQ21837.1 HTH-type transcriptional repressor GlcR [Halobacillus karajensis]CDQ27677.1 HTH-type transcriptional repressor GlcR [Halobacillus karajensis]
MKMFVSERRNKIMQLLNKKKRVTVKELAAHIGVSEATLRTDLNKMEEEGLLTRTHGGAILNEDPDNETSFSAREKKNKEEKTIISEIAFELIEEKQCILLDASSTALELARHLKNQPIRLTVVTSGILTALELKENPDITVILIGGVLTNRSSSIEGTLGLSILEHVNIDIMFTSGNGFSVENGLTDFNLYEVALKKELVKRSNKIVAIVDSSKIGKSSSAVFASPQDIDVLITDKPSGIELSTKLKENNIELITPILN